MGLIPTCGGPLALSLHWSLHEQCSIWTPCLRSTVNYINVSQGQFFFFNLKNTKISWQNVQPVFCIRGKKGQMRYNTKTGHWVRRYRKKSRWIIHKVWSVEPRKSTLCLCRHDVSQTHGVRCSWWLNAGAWRQTAPRFLHKKHFSCLYGYRVYHKAFGTSADVWSCWFWWAAALKILHVLCLITVVSSFIIQLNCSLSIKKHWL